MFRTSCVHYQEDHLYMQFHMVCFSCVYVSDLAGGRILLVMLHNCITVHGTKNKMIYYVYIVVIILIAGKGNVEEGSTEG